MPCHSQTIALWQDPPADVLYLFLSVILLPLCGLLEQGPLPILRCMWLLASAAKPYKRPVLEVVLTTQTDVDQVFLDAQAAILTMVPSKAVNALAHVPMQP